MTWKGEKGADWAWIVAFVVMTITVPLELIYCPHSAMSWMVYGYLKGVAWGIFSFVVAPAIRRRA